MGEGTSGDSVPRRYVVEHDLAALRARERRREMRGECGDPRLWEIVRRGDPRLWPFLGWPRSRYAD